MGIIAAAVTVILSSVITLWLTKSPEIGLRISDPVSFQGEKAKVGVILASVTNPGGKVVEKVKGFVHLPGAGIQEVELAPKELNATFSKTSDRVEFEIPFLNPGDSLQLSFLVSNPKSLPSSLATPEILGARAPDVQGYFEKNKTPISHWISYSVMAFSIIVSVWTLINTITSFRNSRPDAELLKSYKEGEIAFLKSKTIYDHGIVQMEIAKKQYEDSKRTFDDAAKRLEQKNDPSKDEKVG